MVYHLIVAVLGIALLFFGWVWMQRRTAREKCEGLIDEAACVLSPGCHGCGRAVGAKDREAFSEYRTAVVGVERKANAN